MVINHRGPSQLLYATRPTTNASCEVDAHTASTLFNDCVMGALTMKTIVLVTHQVEFFPTVDKILVDT